MHDPKSPKPGMRPATPAPTKTAAPPLRPAVPGVTPPAPASPARPQAAPASRRSARPTGKVVHDDRGNAVWEFIAQTSRICIEATSRLLKKLETPELKIEDAQDEELRVMPEPTKGVPATIRTTRRPSRRRSSDASNPFPRQLRITLNSPAPQRTQAQAPAR